MQCILISLKVKEFPDNNHVNILKAVVKTSGCLEVEVCSVFLKYVILIITL
jgi:hypothetical protein